MDRYYRIEKKKINLINKLIRETLKERTDSQIQKVKAKYKKKLLKFINEQEKKFKVSIKRNIPSCHGIFLKIADMFKYLNIFRLFFTK
jgi:ribosomal protein L22